MSQANACSCNSTDLTLSSHCRQPRFVEASVALIVRVESSSRLRLPKTPSTQVRLHAVFAGDYVRDVIHAFTSVVRDPGSKMEWGTAENVLSHLDVLRCRNDSWRCRACVVFCTVPQASCRGQVSCDCGRPGSRSHVAVCQGRPEISVASTVQPGHDSDATLSAMTTRARCCL
jgi:hypothetical protein